MSEYRLTARGRRVKDLLVLLGGATLAGALLAVVVVSVLLYLTSGVRQ